ncbi:MAG: YgeY family selenium metabolism-linked hydrolase [Candidatus Methanomethylicia archaeon]|nr:YgeY family selenium metabolism-linked hydrolase [Candidatus Methanomethylicia archaeon]
MKAIGIDCKVVEMKNIKNLQKFLIELIEIPSLSGSEIEVAYRIKDKLNDIGVDKVEIDTYGSVIAEIKGKGELKILFEGHMDHVPPGNIDLWIYPPYKAKIVNGEIYGRGTVDMKGSIASLITAIEDISKKELNVNLQLAFVVHEETVEGEAIKRVIEEEKLLDKPDIAILIEPTNLNIALGHRGRSLLNIELKGKTAHASMPNLGINVIESSSQYIIEVMKLNEKLPIHHMLGKATITPIKIKCEPEGLPQLPDKSNIVFDRRMIIGEKEEDLIKPLHEILNKLIEQNIVIDGKVTILEETVKCWTGAVMKVKDFFPAWLIPKEKLDNIGLNNILTDFGKRYIVWDFSTDGVYLANTNILTFGFGPGNWKFAHQPNEKVNLKDLELAVKGYISIVELMEKVC